MKKYISAYGTKSQKYISLKKEGDVLNNLLLCLGQYLLETSSTLTIIHPKAHNFITY